MELSGFNLDYNFIESKFAQVTKTKEEGGAAEAKPKKDGPVTILDPKTSQNLGT